MKYHLLNSAVMPQPGNYELIEIDSETFADEVYMAHKDDMLKHYIGYKSTITLVEQLTGIDLGEMNFEQTELEDGDQLLIIKLKYRATPAEKKEDNPRIDDFLFYNARYTLR